MTDPDREQLKRDCADALEALLREDSVSGLHPLGESIRTLSPTYRAHGEQIQAAAWAREHNTVTWHLIHVLEKLERGS
jgi:hypothetical protein